MISVIIPVYNVEPYLEECLDSVVYQTYTDLQIILVDDGSTDNSGRICDEYASRDSRIQVVHQENRGLSAARNRGIELATGAYLTFVDSDDYLLPDCIETLLQMCTVHDADMSVCAYTRSTDLNKCEQNPEIELFTGTQKMAAYLQLRKLSGVTWGKLYAAELFQTIRYPEGKLFEDIFTSHLLFHAANRVVMTPKKGYFYRIRPGSITTNPQTNHSPDRIHAYLNLVAFIEREYPALLPYAHARFLNYCCVTPLLSIYRSGNPYPDIILQLHLLCRKHIFTYLRYRILPAKKAALLVSFCISPLLPKYLLAINDAIKKHKPSFLQRTRRM